MNVTADEIDKPINGHEKNPAEPIILDKPEVKPDVQKIEPPKVNVSTPKRK